MQFDTIASDNQPQKNDMALNNYRCTRNKPYTPETPGYTDLKARQGHYIQANSPEEAIAQMSKQFPDETDAGFTAELWSDK